MSTENKSPPGIGLVSLLGLLFVALKLMGHIDWSWWWVLSPFWIPLVLVIIIAIMIAWWNGIQDD